MPSIRRSLIVYFLLLLAVALGGDRLLLATPSPPTHWPRGAAAVELIDTHGRRQGAGERTSSTASCWPGPGRSHGRVGESRGPGRSDDARPRGSATLRSAVRDRVLTRPAARRRPVACTAAAPAAPARAGVGDGRIWAASGRPATGERTESNSSCLPHRRGRRTRTPRSSQFNCPRRRQVWKSPGLPSPRLCRSTRQDWSRRSTTSAAGDAGATDATGCRSAGWCTSRRRSRRRSAAAAARHAPSLTGPAAAATPPRPPPHGAGRPAAVIYVHVARPTDRAGSRRRGASMRDAARQKDETRGRPTADTAADASLLLVAGSVSRSPACCSAGGCWSAAAWPPLRKLSDAVSQVSEKDFHLPVTAGELSHELVPIHARLTQPSTAPRGVRPGEAGRGRHLARTPHADRRAARHHRRGPAQAAHAPTSTSRRWRTAGRITKQLGRLVERIMTLAYLDAGRRPGARRPTRRGRTGRAGARRSSARWPRRTA